MIIDFHTHVERKADGRRYTPAEFVAAMDAGGIDKSVVLGGDQADAGTRPAWADPAVMGAATNFDDNDVAAYCAEFPDRLIGFGSIHPDRYQPERKVERAVTELGLRGIKLYPHAGFYPNDPRLDGVYRRCEELRVPVVIHTGVKAVRWQRMKYNRPIYVDDVATSFPKLQVVMCHGGFPWVDEFLAVAHTNPNVWVDISFLDYVERAFHRDGLAQEVVRSLVAVIGAERLLWGSEGPFMELPLYGAHGPDYYARCREFLVERFDFLSAQQKAAILGNNAARLLGLGC
jgi:predicted TIM-barrel fold metal-dependent hydrolase